MKNAASTTLEQNGKKSFKSIIMKYFGLSSLIILVIAFTIMDNSFVNPSNLKNLLSDSAPLMIMAGGMTFVLLLGSVDLSVGAVCSVANVLVVRLMIEFSASMNQSPMAIVLAYILAALFGILAGIILGFVHVKLKVPSFIASLGFMSVWRSVALLVSEAPVSMPKVLWPSIEWAKVTFFEVLGLPLVLAIVVIVLFHVVQTRTPFGKYIMAVGGNERTARMAGIPVDRTKMLAFVAAGLCAALGGIFLAAKLKSSAPTVGNDFTLLVIASVVLGGTALTGGRGKVLGTVIGVFVTSIIRNGMNIVGVDVFWQNIVFGLVILGAVALTIDRNQRNIIVK